jgi:hypothetical protein
MLKYLNMVEQSQETRKGTIIKTGFEPAGKAYSMGDYLDEDGFNNEQRALTKIRGDLSRRLIFSLKFSNQTDKKQWEESSDRIIQIDSAVKGINGVFDNSLIKDTIIGNDVAHLLQAIRDIMTLETIEKQRKIAKKNKFYYEGFEPYEQPTIFELCGNLSMKIGELSILDIVRDKKTSPTDYYNCQINAFITRICITHDNVLSQNKNEFTDLYPNLSRQLIHESSGEILCIGDLSPQMVDKLFGHVLSKSDVTREIIERIKDVVKQTDALEQKVLNAILNPRSEFFSTLKILFEKYFDSDNPTIRIFAIQKLGLKLKERKIMAYRKAEELANENGEQSQFYAKLAKAIKRISIEESPQELNILTHGDVVMFVDENGANKTIPALESLINLKTEILQKSPKLEYVIDPSQIDWQGLIEPTVAAVKFYKDFPHKTNIILDYENARGEKARLSFEINSKKRKIDWNFLESPEDKEMENIKNATLFSIQSTLLATLKLAEAEYRERQKARAVNTVNQPIESDISEKVIKEHKEKTWVPREKYKEIKPKKPSNVDESPQSDALSSKENEVKKYLTPEKGKSINDIIKNIPLESQDYVIDGIRRFNEEGIAKLKPLQMYHEGKKVFERRIGDFRVLATQADVKNENGNGNGNGNEKKSVFEMFEAGNRREIFKKVKK